MWLHEWKPVLNHATFFTVIKKNNKKQHAPGPHKCFFKEKRKRNCELDLKDMDDRLPTYD